MLIRNAYNNPENSDCAIKVGDRTIHAHKTILKLSSKVFNQCFSNDMRENLTSMFEFKDYSPEAVEIAVKYIYGIPVMESTKGSKYSHCELLSIAHFLDIRPMFNAIVPLIPPTADIGELINKAILYDSQAIMARATRICKESASPETTRAHAKSIADKVDIAGYNMFRNLWLKPSPNCINVLLYIDCYYAEQTTDTWEDAIALVDKYIVMITAVKKHLSETILKHMKGFPVINKCNMFQILIDTLIENVREESTTTATIAIPPGQLAMFSMTQKK